jgi:hypothetical protein
MATHWITLANLLFQIVNGKQSSDFHKLDQAEKNYWVTIVKEADWLLKKC